MNWSYSYKVLCIQGLGLVTYGLFFKSVQLPVLILTHNSPADKFQSDLLLHYPVSSYQHATHSEDASKTS